MPTSDLQVGDINDKNHAQQSIEADSARTLEVFRDMLKLLLYTCFFNTELTFHVKVWHRLVLTKRGTQSQEQRRSHHRRDTA